MGEPTFSTSFAPVHEKMLANQGVCGTGHGILELHGRLSVAFRWAWPLLNVAYMWESAFLASLAFARQKVPTDERFAMRLSDLGARIDFSHLTCINQACILIVSKFIQADINHPFRM